VRRLLATAMLLMITAGAAADSVFDAQGAGRDVVPVIGHTRALGGAVVASTDPSSASIINPFGAAYTDKITVSAGFAHTGTTTNNLIQRQRTVTTLFPSIAVTVPLRRISILTGLFVEKAGRVNLTETVGYLDTVFDVDFSRETSIQSVPVMFSGSLASKVIVSAGILLSFLDTREKTIRDFRATKYSDSEDVYDLSATGESFAGGLLVDLNRFRIAGTLRTATDLDGTLESENRYAGIWSSRNVKISSEASYSLGLFMRPIDAVAAEIDYVRSPWCGLHMDGRAITTETVNRWSFGFQYRGRRIWNADKYPLIVGYYRQPLDWGPDSTMAGPVTPGKIIEQMFSIGTSIPIGDDRGLISFSLEYGNRQTDYGSDLEEDIFGFALSISAMEAWRREIRR
jgi:hypothetical protein